MTGVGWWNADDGVTGTLASREYKDTAHVVVSALTSNMAGAGGGVDDNTAQGGHLVPYVKAKRAQTDQDYETWRASGPAPTLNAMDNTAESRATVLAVTAAVTHTLTAEGHDAGEDGTGQGTPIIGFSHTAGIDHQADESTFPPPMAGHDRMPAVATSSAVRRLTPVECERLQGFPDGWTAQRVERSGRRAGQVADQFDSARYRQMGNAVTVDVFAWVMRRLAAVDAGDAS